MAKRATTTRSSKSNKSKTDGTSVKKKAPKAKAKAKPKAKARSTAGDDDEEVKLDRRRGDRRDEESEVEAPEESTKSGPPLERRKKVNRRRQIDPTTCERDYSDEEIEFMNALDDYKRASGRMFPTCSEVLEVIRSLGYVKRAPGELVASQVEPVVVGVCEADSADDWNEIDAF